MKLEIGQEWVSSETFAGKGHVIVKILDIYGDDDDMCEYSDEWTIGDPMIRNHTTSVFYRMHAFKEKNWILINNKQENFHTLYGKLTT